MGSKTKIDWCDATWNPVTGCNNRCEYCYARKMARRFGGSAIKKYGLIGLFGACRFGEEKIVLDKPFRNDEGKIDPYPIEFYPTFHLYRLDEPQKWKKKKNIFVCSMADLFGDWVPELWITRVFSACEKVPQHNYIFLTKNFKRVIALEKKGLLPSKHWYGYTATKESDLLHFHHADECSIKNMFISIEPIQEYMKFTISTHCPADWIIVGAETGKRKQKIIPDESWLDSIIINNFYGGIPVFMKESLRYLAGDNFIQEYPKGLKNE